MKSSSVALPAAAAKRRWKGLVVAVLCLVFLSMLVPLVFLLGLHNGFLSVSSGYGTEQRTPVSNGVRVYDQQGSSKTNNWLEDMRRNTVKEYENRTVVAGSSSASSVPKHSSKTNNARVVNTGDVNANIKKGIYDGENLCESKFGSYCLWRLEHREKIKDSIVKKMKDQLYVARAYYPSIAKLASLEKVSHELKQNIQDFERILSESSTDTDLPPLIVKKLQKMEAAIAKAKSFHVDCNNVDKKLRQLVDLTEEEANFHTKQSAFMYQLAVQTMPKNLHCLSMRLTMEYFRFQPETQSSLADEYVNPELQHYVLFSTNVLASSVVINSTVIHSKDSRKQVFHVLTDRQNYFAMKLWFLMYTYKEAAVEVLNIEDLNLIDHNKKIPAHLSLPQEFRVSFQIDDRAAARIRTEYISVFSYMHYLLPKIFKTLNKVVVLDDDIIVQRDLSALWSLNMHGKVNAAVQFCALKVGPLKKYFGEKRLNGNSCSWMSGLNVVDLVRWREQDITAKFQRLVQELNVPEGLSDAISLRAYLLTFEGLIYPLDDKWVISGLGYNYGLDSDAIKKAAVLHFNGNMKPWLELGIPKYKGFWRKFLNKENQFLSDCNVNP